MTGSQDRVGGQVESDDERRTICGPLTGIDEQKGVPVQGAEATQLNTGI